MMFRAGDVISESFEMACPCSLDLGDCYNLQVEGF